MKIYSCGTYYHALITAIKIMINGEKADLLLANDIPGFNVLKERLSQSGLFRSIFIYDAKAFSESYVFKNVVDHAFNARKIVYEKIPCMVTLSSSQWRDYSDIYIFNDSTGVAKYLILNGIKYHLIEDALDYFSYFDKYYKIPEGAFSEKGFIKTLKNAFGIGFNVFGQNEACIDIEVNSVENIKIPTNKVFAISRSEMFSSLSREQRKLIFSIFAKDKTFKGKNNDKSMILLTQPLFKDAFVKSMEEQYVIFETVIIDYSKKGYSISIKPHPRDEMDYFPLINKYGCTYIDKKLPSEILNFDEDAYFDVAVSITSTAINALNNAREKRFMGREFIKNCLNEE